MSYEWLTLDVFDAVLTLDLNRFDLIVADPVYSDSEQLNLVASLPGPKLMFCYPEDVQLLAKRPDQLCHWVKPVSTKNTSKKYSRFVEAICVWHGPFFNQSVHWSNRTGIFSDHIVETNGHPWKKPKSLLEKLVQLHCPPGGRVLDLFAGSGTTEDACRETGRSCLSIEIDPKWARAV